MEDIRHIRITVYPGSSKDYVETCKDRDAFNVYVRAQAVNGEANKAALQCVRNFLDIDGQIRIVSGHRSPQKILAIPTN